MKRILILCSVIIAVLAMNACEKLPKGTGILKVEVSVFMLKIMFVYILMDLMTIRNLSIRQWQ